MQLGRVDWMERYALYARSYYDAVGPALISRMLRPGDTFIDVGANLGFIALAAARSVGPEGRVIAIEANPELARRLVECASVNGLNHLKVIPSAVGSEDGTLSFRVNSQHGTSRAATGADCVEVPVRRGDALCDVPDQSAPLFVKIDVEGFEMKVIDGFSRHLSRPNVAAYVEVIPAYLENYGDSAGALFEAMAAHGFTAHVADLDKLSRLSVKPAEGALASHQRDVLFVKGVFRERVEATF